MHLAALHDKRILACRVKELPSCELEQFRTGSQSCRDLCTCLLLSVLLDPLIAVVLFAYLNLSAYIIFCNFELLQFMT